LDVNDAHVPIESVNTRAAILDYASPRPRGKLRLPANSDLSMRAIAGGVEILETLKGKASAYGALGFGAFVLWPLSATLYETWRLALRREQFGEWLFCALVICMMLALLVTMILVVNETWRKTIARADAEGLSVHFRALLRRRDYRWPRQYVGDVRVVATQDSTDAPPLGEIEIHLVDQPLIKLFTDHLRPKLVEIARVMREALGVEPEQDDRGDAAR
jgi:hypothetical protein